MAALNNIQALNHALELAMKKDESIIIYGEDAGFEGGVFRATVGLQEKFGENRVFDAPIAEATLAGQAIGMGVAGMRPIVEMQFEGFSLPAFQNIFAHIARFRNRTRGRWTCPIVIRMPMGGGIRALEHHSEALEAMFAHCPGLTVVIPSTPFDTKGLLLSAIESNDPVIFLEPTKIYRAFKQEIPDEYYTLPLGKAYTIQEGNDLSIVTYGAQVMDCEKAVAAYQNENPNATIELIDLRTIQPWDKKTIVESVKKTGRLLVVHEAVRSFSVSSEIIASIQSECFEYLKAPCARVTGYDIMIPFDAGEYFHQPNVNKVLDKIRETIEFKF
ncbi:pyruvate dehydrogenase E1 component subunit beta [Spiroplasma sabaudiense Ar-1343]|uniref:Pyruvate dehydrogenase E1 component subunit beta n=1 Tax=Spiroplasma sabaudiense Ar-1343 TaxID=1276257 RepID=W6A9J5_9MOLU|nr:alpha-ketoacid dehydrogenase subunit beta [Spiroplasma sabaudiense]AHI53656.1 pyruvate dehydrogenase E1 component subunit beta [Spiroplasma sabaudiense Ar-1343]